MVPVTVKLMEASKMVWPPCRAVTRRVKNLDDSYPKAEQHTVAVAASPAWRSYHVELVVPDGVRYLGLILQPAAVGELAVDDVQLLPVGRRSREPHTP